MPDLQRLGASKRRILVLLCAGRHTVADLAVQLAVTDNAVRAQLQRLQRDGLAREAGSRRGVRRPHAEYELTPKAHELFPRAYEPALRALVDVFVERFSDRVARDLFLRAGRRLFSERFGKLRGRSPRQRLAEVVARLDGARVGVEVTEEPGALVLQACSCPLASLTASRPQICELVAALLGGVLRADVQERCVRGDSPRCCFEVGTNGRAAKPRGST